MIEIFKSKTFICFLLILALLMSFYNWQGKRELTKQLVEKTKQLETIMANPIIKKVEGPIRIVKGKTIIKTVIVEKKPDGSEIKTETEIINDPIIIDKESTNNEINYKDPSVIIKEKKYTLMVGYTWDDEITVGVTKNFYLVEVGPMFKYNYRDNNITAGVFVIVRF